MAKKKSIRRRPRQPPPKLISLRRTRAAVVGLNAVGRQIALLLAASGVRSLLLVDHRQVTRRTQQNDGYTHDDVGRLRTHATAQQCHEVAPGLDVSTSAGRASCDFGAVDVIFHCGEFTATGSKPKPEPSPPCRAAPLVWVRVTPTAGAHPAIRIDIVGRGTSRRRSVEHQPVERDRDSQSARACIPPSAAAVAAGLAVHAWAPGLAGYGPCRRITLDLGRMLS